MDLKALMQKLETINKTEILTESEKKETTWTDKSGKKHPATQVKGDKYTGKEADKEAKKSKKDDLEENFTSAIARGLVEEFGYDLDERITINPDGTTSGKIAPPPAAAAPSPWANDPAKDAAWKALSPEDQKWLGGADPTDPYILARAPNKGKPAATAPGAGTKPAAAAPAAAAAPTGTTAQGDDEGNTMITKPDGTVQVVGPDGNVIPPGGGKETPPGGAKPAAADPAVAATREKFKALMDKLEKTGGVSGSAPAPAAPAKPATGASTKPAATGFANTGGGAAVGNPNMAKQGVAKESVTYQDDQTLLAIKNIRF
jgi:hypothetical protein